MFRNAFLCVVLFSPAFYILVLMQSNGMMIKVLTTATNADPTKSNLDGIGSLVDMFKYDLNVCFICSSAIRNVTQATVYLVNRGK